MECWTKPMQLMAGKVKIRKPKPIHQPHTPILWFAYNNHTHSHVDTIEEAQEQRLLVIHVHVLYVVALACGVFIYRHWSMAVRYDVAFLVISNLVTLTCWIPASPPSVHIISVKIVHFVFHSLPPVDYYSYKFGRRGSSYLHCLCVFVSL